jgi:hypothetical protein
VSLTSQRSVYEDGDHTRQEEIAALGGGNNVFSAFYDRLKVSTASTGLVFLFLPVDGTPLSPHVGRKREIAPLCIVMGQRKPNNPPTPAVAGYRMTENLDPRA